jgi:hypothetical protein
MTAREAVKLTEAQKNVLRELSKGKNVRLTPALAYVTVSTWKALARRKLILVETTFASIVTPRTAAWATITPAGRAALREGEG